MRRAFVDTMISLAERDPRIILLTGDLGFHVFDEFIARFGKRYINVGIAEAQMVCAAAGLAMEGFRPFVYSIASFMTGRPFEHIRVSICYPGLPVVVVGAGGGYCYATSGVTHHAPDDLGLMAMLPGMTVTAPGDPNEVKSLLPQLAALDGPSYIRIGKFGEPTYQSDSPVKLGEARLLRDGEKVAIITTGEMAPITLEAHAELAKEKIHPAVYQFHTIKPIDTAVLNRIAKTVKVILIVEEASPQGGLSNAIMQWGAMAENRPRFMRLGPPDAFILGNLRRERLRERFGFDQASIVRTCRMAWTSV